MGICPAFFFRISTPVTAGAVLQDSGGTTQRSRQVNPIESMFQRSATGGMLYFPPGCGELLQDPTVPIILVEAEKSALALTALAQRVRSKYLAVAMGGCWGWRGRIGKVNNERGERVDELGPLPDLACASSGRVVIILLDSNASSNPRVQQAQRALRSQLIKQGAEVLIAKLPVIAGVNGPDDYIGVAGDDAMATVLSAAGARPTETLWTAK